MASQPEGGTPIEHSFPLRPLGITLLVVGMAAIAVLTLDAWLQRSFAAGHHRIDVGDDALDVVGALARARTEQELLPGISGQSAFHGPFCLVDDLLDDVVGWQAYAVRGVEVQQVVGGRLRVRLTRQSRGCPEGRCWQPVGDFEVARGEEWLEQNGCALFAGALVRVESPARLFPPLTHDYFLVRFDGAGEVEWRSLVYGMGESAYLDEPSPDTTVRSRDARIYRRLAGEVREGDRPIVVESSTLRGSEVPTAPGVGSLDPDLLARLRGAPSSPLPGDLDRSEALVLYASGEDFRDTQGWERFQRRFPWAGGFYRFSPVTWSDEGTRALVYVIGWHVVLYDPPDWALTPVRDDRTGYYQFELDGNGNDPTFVSAVVEEELEVEDPERSSYRPPPRSSR